MISMIQINIGYLVKNIQRFHVRAKSLFQICMYGRIIQIWYSKCAYLWNYDFYDTNKNMIYCKEHTAISSTDKSLFQICMYGRIIQIWYSKCAYLWNYDFYDTNKNMIYSKKTYSVFKYGPKVSFRYACMAGKFKCVITNAHIYEIMISMILINIWYIVKNIQRSQVRAKSLSDMYVCIIQIYNENTHIL